jgi:hypothetical protein
MLLSSDRRLGRRWSNGGNCGRFNRLDRLGKTVIVLIQIKARQDDDDSKTS